MWGRNRDIIEGEARQFIEREMESLRAGAESGEVENKAEDQGKMTGSKQKRKSEKMSGKLGVI